MRSELESLPPLPDMSEKIDRFERFFFLDLVAFGGSERPNVGRGRIVGRHCEPEAT